MKIKFIPQKIKRILIKNQYVEFQLKGHKKISEKKNKYYTI
uniref:Cytochrome b6-f complex subunit PetP n=1 Tax=Vertebrata isogona TaxID=2006944 RepID=A0A1Z1MFR1_9FLOR|nr:cytochrome b6-f complex subunit PetP [Vertebrata isogona]ARW64655.1 cytochrome b6-f complex subunit PetP [Vertebrata isogona]